MPLPGNLTTITVTGTYLTAIGAPCAGTVTFSLDYPVADGTGAAIIYSSDTVEPLDSNGHLTITLACTDNTTISPEPFTYRVTEKIAGRPQRVYSISLPSNLAPTVDLSTIAPVAPVNPSTNPITVGYAAGGDLSGTYPSPTVARVHGVAVSGTPSVGEVLTATSATTADWQPGGSAGALLAANDLSDVQSPVTSRANLGLGSAATQPASSFDAAGSAAAAQTAAEADAASKYLPLRPWLFDVTTAAYGAKGDGIVVTDGAITSGQAVLTSPGNGFANVTAGMLVMVKGAGPSGVTTLVTTVANKQSSGQITLAANASTTVSGALVMIASDDTAAIQSAINAALAYAEVHGSATVFLPPAAGSFYGIGGALQTGGSTKGNAQLTLGAPVATTGNKVCLTIEGAGNGSALQHWLQLSPQVGGSTLVSFGVFASAGAQTASINAAGNACVIGGPSQPSGYGVSPGIFSNMLITLKGLSILTTHSVNGFTFSACDFSGIAEANLHDVAYGTTGSVAAGDYSNPAALGTGLSVGVLMPANGNNDANHISNLSCHGGYTYAIFATEHTVIDRICILYCWAALCPVGAYYGSVGSVHGVNVVQASIEQCTNLVYVVGAGSNGTGPWLFATISTESGGPTFSGNSSTAINALLGEVMLTGEFTVSGINVTSPTGLKIVNGQQAYPVTAINSSTQTTYTVSVVDQTILVDTTTAAVTVTLISAAWTPNTYTVVNTGTHAVTIATTGGQTIDGASTLVLSGQWSKATLIPARVNGVWGWYQTA